MSRRVGSPKEPASPKRVAFRREGGPVARRVLARAGIAAATILVVLGGALWLRAARGPQPPRLVDLGAMDPEVASLIGQQIAAVDDARTDPRAWAQLGLACEANGFIAVAAQAFETAASLDPNNPRSWYRTALLRSRRGDAAGALAALDRVVALAGDYAPAHWHRGLWLLDRGDDQAAEASFRRATEVDADDPAGWVGLARVYLSRREDQRAADVLERLLNDHPGNRHALQLLGAAYRRLGREDDAAFALAVGSGGGPIWRDPWSDEVSPFRRGFASVLKEATALAMAGEFPRAITLLEQLRTARPNDLALANHLGGVYAASGRLSEAIAVLESVLARDPENFDAHLNLATAHLFARVFAPAERHVDRALAIRPTSARALETRGMILWQSGRPSEARPVLDAAIARDPRSARARAWIGLLLVEQRQPRDALPYFDAALRTDPMFADAMVGLGMAHIQLGDRAEAALVLQRAQQVDPSNPRLATAMRLLEATGSAR